MNDPLIFSLAILPPFLLWFFIFLKREDLRQELVVMSTLTGFIAIFYSYYFLGLSLTPVENFMAGFIGGGIMAVIYEVIFKQALHERKKHHHTGGAFTLILMLAALILFFFHVCGWTTFWSTAMAFVFVAGMTVLMRKDLFMNAVLTGALMCILYLIPHYMIAFASPHFDLSLPVLEMIFWFLAGTVFGPFYEYWQGAKLSRYKK